MHPCIHLRMDSFINIAIDAVIRVCIQVRVYEFISFCVNASYNVLSCSMNLFVGACVIIVIHLLLCITSHIINGLRLRYMITSGAIYLHNSDLLFSAIMFLNHQYC